MRRVVVINFVSLDGVIQSPLSPDEDRDGGFEHGGWVSDQMDDTVATIMGEVTAGAAGMLLGRTTYETFAASWSTADPSDPAVAAMNRMPKYVVSSTITDGPWAPTIVLTGDVPRAVADLKADGEGDLVVFGSGRLVSTLIEHDLVDEYRLLTFPVLLGGGKSMFPEAGRRVALELVSSTTSTTGVMITTYRPALHRD